MSVFARIPNAASVEANGLAQLRTVAFTIWLIGSVPCQRSTPSSHSSGAANNDGRDGEGGASGAFLVSPGRS